MLYKMLSICLFISVCSIATAQNSFKIKGIVLDANTLQPLEGANIIGDHLFAVSSSKGEFTIEDNKKQASSFTVSHVGYTTKEFTVIPKNTQERIKIYLKETSTVLNEVKVVGTYHNKDKETPMVTQTVTKKFLNNNRENSLMQTLSKIPGISTINIGSGQSKPVIRGLGFNRVAVVQNGIKHEAQQWGNDHGLEIDQQGIENIQIIKGPASLLFGSDAIAGVVHIQPNKVPLQNSFNGEVNILGESNNDLLGISAGISARKEKWFYRTRVTYRDYGDYKVPTTKINYENYVFELHNNNLRNTAGREANASVSIGYVDNTIKTETLFSNVNAKNGFFANAHGLEVRTSKIDYDTSNRDIDLPYHNVNHFKISNNTTINTSNHVLHFDLGFQNNKREEHSEPIPHGYMPKPPNTKERVFTKNTYSLNARDAFNINNKHNVVVGVNLEHQKNTIGGWGFLIPEYSRFTAGAFGYNQYKINKNWHILAGARYDYGVLKTSAYNDWFRSTVKNEDNTTSQVYLQRAKNKTLDFKNISASFGVSHIKNNTTYKVNLGKSFRMPLANELASDGVNYHMYRFEKGNLDLKPEVAYQLDLDINHTKKKFSLGISPFLNLFENYIYLNPTSNYFETLQIYEYTQSKVFRIGGELSASTTVIKNLELAASAEYVYSRQTSGLKKDFTLPFSPPLSGLFSVSYKIKDFSVFKTPAINADYRITATQEDIVPPEQTTDGYNVLHMSFTSKLDIFKNSAPIDVRLKLNNVFNTTYYNHTSFYRLIDVPEAGRNISVSLTIPFK